MPFICLSVVLLVTIGIRVRPSLALSDKIMTERTRLKTMDERLVIQKTRLNEVSRG